MRLTFSEAADDLRGTEKRSTGNRPVSDGLGTRQSLSPPHRRLAVCATDFGRRILTEDDNHSRRVRRKPHDSGNPAETGTSAIG